MSTFKDINIKYFWDEKLTIQSSLDIYEYELKISNKKFIGWFFIALAQFGVVGALKHNAYGLLIIATIGILYWYGLRWPLRKFFILRSFKKSALANTDIMLTAKQDGIYIDNQLQIAYDSIIKSVQLTNAIVIYHTLGTIYIPNNSFENAKERKRFSSKINLIS